MNTVIGLHCENISFNNFQIDDGHASYIAEKHRSANHTPSKNTKCLFAGLMGSTCLCQECEAVS